MPAQGPQVEQSFISKGPFMSKPLASPVFLFHFFFSPLGVPSLCPLTLPCPPALLFDPSPPPSLSPTLLPPPLPHLLDGA